MKLTIPGRFQCISLSLGLRNDWWLTRWRIYWWCFSWDLLLRVLVTHLDQDNIVFFLSFIFRRIQCGWPQWAGRQTRAQKMPRPWNSFGSQTWRSTGCRWWSLEQSNFDGNHVWGVQEAPHLGWNGWIEDLSVTLRASSGKYMIP